MKRRKIIENPERATVGRDNEILLLDHHIGNLNDRQVQLKRLPIVSIIEGNVHAELSASIKQPFAIRVLTNNPYKVVGGNTVVRCY